MKVSKLLEIVATELNASPRQLKSVLRDLDNLISTAVEENQLLSRRSSFLLKGRCSTKKRIGYSLQGINERKFRYDHPAIGSYETVKEDGTLLYEKFIKDKRKIDRNHSIDLGELSRRTVVKFDA
ncbi:unnamed protein product [Acanthocheilonema viteae]|uniref:Uncharacterized protein n=1 Tax=Acanthocheilonema viteae TaxID=6277 RepID=A0A498SRW7_ACAVI|nr:unnamed protein product [Acanthocheilonema viteae]